MSNIDSYWQRSIQGNIILEKEFNIGAFLGRKNIESDFIRQFDWTGFRAGKTSTTFSGDVYKLKYNGYTYTKEVIVDGNFKIRFSRRYSSMIKFVLDFQWFEVNLLKGITWFRNTKLV
jgi:hypothetical protein